MKQDKFTLKQALMIGSIFPTILIFDFFIFLNGIEFLGMVYALYANFSYWNFLIIPLTILLIGLGILISIRVVVGYML